MVKHTNLLIVLLWGFGEVLDVKHLLHIRYLANVSCFRIIWETEAVGRPRKVMEREAQTVECHGKCWTRAGQLKARRRYTVDCCTGKNGCMERTVATAKATQFPRAGEHPPPGAVSTEHPSRTAIGQHSDVFNPSLLLPKNTPWASPQAWSWSRG